MNPVLYLKSCLDHIVAAKGTDLYLKRGSIPYYRASNQLKAFPDLKTISSEEITEIVNFMLRDNHKITLEQEKSVDLSFIVEGHGRLRANIFYQQGELGVVVRIAWKTIPSFETLGIPSPLKKWALAERGLIIIAGAASAGKSTTANCMINSINENMEKHIITIEDPIEFVHTNKRSLINQREVGLDTPSFASALRYATRQAPDVIFIGEIRDAETFVSALSAAEIGRLVISTVHARNVMHVFERLLSFFKAEERMRVLTEISYNLNVIVSQRLVPRMDGGGYVAAFELLTMTGLVQEMIRQQKFDKLLQVMQGGAADGMMSLNQSLLKLKSEGLISELEMYRASDRPHDLQMSVKGIGLAGHASQKILGD